MANTTGKKFGGRKKGSENLKTVEVKNFIQEFINKNSLTLQADYDKLDPKDRIYFMEKLFRLITPRPVDELQTLTDSQLDQLIEKLKNPSNE